MGRGAGADFAERDARAAANFGEAAAAAGVERLVYLGGLGEPGSEHLRSRHQTAEILERSGVPLTYFRAAAVIGSGSESFRVVYYLVKRLPAMVTPRWVSTRTQPIAIADVIAYLRAAPGIEAAAGREIEIGGPEVDHLRRDDEGDGAGARPPTAGPDPGASTHAAALVALDRARDAGRRRRRAAADRGTGDRDRRRGPVRDGALRRRADAARPGDARSARRAGRQPGPGSLSAKARARSSSIVPVSWSSKRRALITAPASSARLTR